jgi:hypothetical protein
VEREAFFFESAGPTMKERNYWMGFAGLMLAVVVTLCCSCRSSSEAPGDKIVKINPAHSEDEIVAELLQYTPVGMSDADVMEFARTHLKHGDLAPAYIGTDTIAVFLGKIGSGFVGPMEIWVQWRFDNDHKLMRIEVSKEHNTL